MPERDIVVVGGSTGSIEVLQRLVSELPADLGAALFVVVHIAPDSRGVLPQILSRAGPLPAAHGVDQDRIMPGRIYVAPPDHHLLVESGRLRVTRGPRENRFRPAIDPLFRTAGHVYGRRVIGVVVSGGGDDGTLGAAVIAKSGGLVLAQDPDDALAPSMPMNVIDYVRVERVVRSADLAAAIVELVGNRKGKGALAMRNHEPHDIAEAGSEALRHQDVMGPPSAFTCPQCGGALWELDEHNVLRYRCHVGHGYTADSLIGAQREALEDALWTALRALEENSGLRRRMAERARSRQMETIAQAYDEEAWNFAHQADAIRGVLLEERDVSGPAVVVAAPEEKIEKVKDG